MEDHRSTQNTVSKTSHQNNVNAMDAVGILHAQLVRLEALVLVACEAADRLQPPSGRTAKRELIRMQIFIGQAAADASSAVACGDRLMADLTAKNRRRLPRARPGAGVPLANA